MGHKKPHLFESYKPLESTRRLFKRVCWFSLRFRREQKLKALYGFQGFGFNSYPSTRGSNRYLRNSSSQSILSHFFYQ